MKNPKKGYPFLIIAGTLVILIGLSFVPWGDLTGGRIKNFNLFSDLFPGNAEESATADSEDESIDPELKAAMAKIGKDLTSIQIAVPDGEVEPESEDALIKSNKIKKTQIIEGKDSINLVEVVNPKAPVENKTKDGTVIIEDYTVGGVGMANLKRALGSVSSRPVRIAVIGDSYIEGDILTMNIRESLQDKYGGGGVGYVPASSIVNHFRTTVKHNESGWTKHDIRKEAREGMKTLSGEYFTASGTGKASYKGVSKLAHLNSWNRSMVLAVAPKGGTITIKTDAGGDTLRLPADDEVHAVTVNSTTTTADITASNGVEIVGIYLNNSNGICVDNMSLRGNSGITHRKLSPGRAAQMRRYADYDMIVVEYGINALSAGQSDYSNYRKLMMQTISRIKECYPNADIVLMGIGDRGHKSGGEVKSMGTARNMVEAQRDAARMTGVLFWDTREAMGGDGAVIDWRAKGLINPDYIHLNHKGGKALADLFVQSLLKSL